MVTCDLENYHLAQNMDSSNCVQNSVIVLIGF